MIISKHISKVILNIFIIFFLFLTLYPLWFTFMTSLKDNEQFFKKFWLLPNPWHFENYRDAVRVILPYLGNSFIISIGSLAILLLTASMAAYAFARLRCPFKEGIFMILLALLMIPGILELIPQYLILKHLGLLRPTGIRPFLGIMLGYIAGQQAFSIFIIRSFFDSQPEELFDAARIDGCNEYYAYVKIALPLIKPVLATISIIVLLSIWNDYLWPFVVTNNEKYYTISLGLLRFQGSLGRVMLYGPSFAGYVVSALPLMILYLMLMRYFIEGMTAGAIKM